MPNKVAVSVKNCATTKRTLDAISWSSDIARETKVRTTATANEAVAMVFSSMRDVLAMLESDSVIESWEQVSEPDLLCRHVANLRYDRHLNVHVQVVLNRRPSVSLLIFRVSQVRA